MSISDSKFSIVKLEQDIRFSGGGIKEITEKVTAELLITKYNDNPEISGMDEDNNLTWTIRVYLAENLEKKLCFTYAGSSEEIKINKEAADKHLEQNRWEFQKWIEYELNKDR